MCYYELKSIVLSSGLNILLGENGEGKTKLYEALYWLLNVKTTSVDDLFHLVSMKKIRETEIGGTITLSVQIDVRQGGSKKTLLKEYVCRKKTNSHLEIVSNRIIGIEENELGERIEVKFDQLLQAIFPVEIRRYSMFKGEAELNIFENEDAFSNLVKQYSDSRHFDKYVDYSNQFLKTVQRQITADTRLRVASQRDYDNAVSDYKKQKDTIDSLKDRINEYESTIADLSKKIAVAELHVSNSQELSDINKSINILQERIRKKRAELKEKYTNYLFDEKWILLNYPKVFEEFSSIIKEVSLEKRSMQSAYDREIGEKMGAKTLKRRALQELIGTHTPLPINVPGQSILEELLESEHCKVCNRPAPIGSEAYNFIAERLNAYLAIQSPEVDSQEENLFNSSNIEDLSLMMNIQRDRFVEVNKIKESISETLDFNRRIKDDIEALEEELRLEEQRKISLIGSSSIAEGSLTRLLHEYGGWTKTLNETEGYLAKAKEEELEATKELSRLRKKIDDIDLSSASKTLLKIKKIHEKIEVVVKRVRAKKMEAFVEELQGKINEYMLEINHNAFTGNVKLGRSINQDGNMMLDIAMYEGESLLRDPGAAHKTSMYIASLFAISKMAELRTEESFPLIFDAPTSSFGSSKRDYFYNIISRSSNQIIVMTKDYLVREKGSMELSVSNEFSSINRDKAIWLKLERPFDSDDLSTINTLVEYI
jgi:DNA sulfur modification protein DndD